MRRTWRLAVFCLAAGAGCADDPDAGCATSACAADCVRRGFSGGVCGGEICACIAGPDAGTDEATSDVPADPGGDEAAAAWRPTAGTQAAVDRTAPCTEAQLSQWRHAPEEWAVMQSCLPNYFVWAPVVCGNPMPDCACDDAACLPGEAPKPVNGGEFCVCLNLCSIQEDSARCGAADERDCIPVDDWTGTQVFICGGEL